MLKFIKSNLFAFASIAFFLPVIFAMSDAPKLNIGMNLNSNNYYSNSLIFTDVMKTASEWLTYNVSGSGPWDTGKISKIPLDAQGYPLEIPAKVDDGPLQGVKFLINNLYKGDYLFLYDGQGEFDFAVPTTKSNGKVIIHLDGKGENRWISIKKSNKNNRVRNIRIIPKGLSYDPKFPFNPIFLEGLEKFHCLRFMDFMNTNNSSQTTWDTRCPPDYYTQGGNKGIAIEYGIQLCNQLKCDAWFCVPHMADDDYIRRFAQLVEDNLDPNLKVYVEYSNEIWNWLFSQSQYVLHNAPGAINKYVSEALKGINPQGSDHPEKDAYMMQRVFKIWSEVFGQDKHRLVRVAAVQHAWVDNTKRVLEYLFKYDQNGKPITGKRYQASTGAGCDVVSPAGYFGYSDADKAKWLSMSPKQVTADVILDAVKKSYNKESGNWTLSTAKYAKAWNVGYVVYEGGQHIQPFDQNDTPYNEAIWDAQINPKMYDMYMTLFQTHDKPEVDCKLFCAYSYVTGRKSRWGSWGHLENLDQLHDISNIKTIAPKYSALIEANLSK